MSCLIILLIASCSNLRKQTTANDNITTQPLGPVFCADSAFVFCQEQCDFGPRTMNS